MLDIGAVLVPAQQPSRDEGVSQVVNARSARAPVSGPAQTLLEPAEGLVPGRPHRTAQHRVGRRENVFVAEPAPRPREQRRRAVEPQRFVFEEPHQPFAGGGVERAQSQVLTDALLMLGDRLLPARVGVDRLGVGSQLQGREPQDLPVDLQGRLLGEPPEHTHEGDLVREAQPIVGTPPKGDLSSVGLEYARQHDFRIDEFIEATASGQASEKRRRLDELTSLLQRGDRLVVSELSRLGRSLGQIVTILDALAKAGVAFVALKENIRVAGKRDIQTKVMTTLFALFAEVERDLISERTREGLARARASGRKLGRPKGSLGVSRLDGKEDEIRRFLELGVSKTAIAKITGVSRTALYSFMSTRGLRPTP